MLWMVKEIENGLMADVLGVGGWDGLGKLGLGHPLAMHGEGCSEDVGEVAVDGVDLAFVDWGAARFLGVEAQELMLDVGYTRQGERSLK